MSQISTPPLTQLTKLDPFSANLSHVRESRRVCGNWPELCSCVMPSSAHEGKKRGKRPAPHPVLIIGISWCCPLRTSARTAEQKLGRWQVFRDRRAKMRPTPGGKSKQKRAALSTRHLTAAHPYRPFPLRCLERLIELAHQSLVFFQVARVDDLHQRTALACDCRFFIFVEHMDRILSSEINGKVAARGLTFALNDSKLFLIFLLLLPSEISESSHPLGE